MKQAALRALRVLQVASDRTRRAPSPKPEPKRRGRPSKLLALYIAGRLGNGWA